MPKYTEAMLLTDGAGQVISQYLDTNDLTDSPNGTFKPVTFETMKQILIQNFPEQQNVSDSDALEKLNDLTVLINALNDKLAGTLNTEVAGNSMEFFGKSTEAKPAAATTKVGATYFEVDTTDLYMNDGTGWVAI